MAYVIDKKMLDKLLPKVSKNPVLMKQIISFAFQELNKPEPMKGRSRQLIMDFLQAHQGKSFSPTAVATAIKKDYDTLGLKTACVKYVSDTLWKLWKQGEIIAYEDSTYGV